MRLSPDLVAIAVMLTGSIILAPDPSASLAQKSAFTAAGVLLILALKREVGRLSIEKDRDTTDLVIQSMASLAFCAHFAGFCYRLFVLR